MNKATKAQALTAAQQRELEISQLNARAVSAQVAMFNAKWVFDHARSEREDRLKGLEAERRAIDAEIDKLRRELRSITK